MSYSMLRDMPMRMRRCRKRKIPLMILAASTLPAAMESFVQEISVQFSSIAWPTMRGMKSPEDSAGEDANYSDRQLKFVIAKVECKFP